MAKIAYDKYDVNSAVNTLIEAEEIKRNTVLFPKVKKAFLKKQAAMQRTALEIKVGKKLNELHSPKG